MLVHRPFSIQGENMKKGWRATHCKQGHAFTPENTYISKDGKQHCRSCRQSWMDTHRDSMNISCRKYYKKNQVREQARKRKALYDMDEMTYAGKPKEQGGVCAISGLLDLAVDHDHFTGTNRGLLNRKINSAIGLFQENPEWLRKAADYIEHWRDYDRRAVGAVVSETLAGQELST